MSGMTRRMAVLGCVLAATGVAACGGSDGGGDGDGGRDGGTVRLGAPSFPDSLDPGLAYTAESWQLLWNVYTGLLTYRHAEGDAGSVVVPGLAEALPRVTDGGRTYTLRLRPGLRYSDGSAVRAGDFEHAVKRALALESGTGFFLGVAGAGEFLEAGGKTGDISGIRADERTREITIRLTEPDGRFPNILAMTFAAPVPRDTPLTDQSKRPPPGVGAFRIDGIEGTRRFSLVKVPRYSIPGLPQAKVDRIDTEVISNRRRLTQQTIRNRLDVQIDPPAPDQVRDVRNRFGGERYDEFTTQSTYFFTLNHEVPPFDDERVRRAANLAADQDAVSRAFGGLLEPSCNFLPPGVPGHRPINPCPWGEPGARSDLGTARQLVRQAGAEGADVIVYGSDVPEFKASAEYFADTLTQIGLDARPRIVEESQYIATFTDRSLKVQSAIINWFEDFPHPTNFLTLVDKRGIELGLNPGYIDDPVINRTMLRADRLPLQDAAGDYAAVDRRTIERAHVVPLGHRRLSIFMSERMQFGEQCNLVHPVYSTDLTSLCLK